MQYREQVKLKKKINKVSFNKKRNFEHIFTILFIQDLILTFISVYNVIILPGIKN